MPKEHQAAGEIPPNCPIERAIGAVYYEYYYDLAYYGDLLLHTGCTDFGWVWRDNVLSFLIAPGIGAACEFFEDNNCQGKSLWVAEDRSDQTVRGNGASSAMCGTTMCDEDYAGVVFDGPGFADASQTLKMGCTNIDRNSLKTGVSSYMVFPGRSCYVYSIEKEIVKGKIFNLPRVVTRAIIQPH